jgi:hypothetical protein
MNKILAAGIQIAMFASTLSGADASTEERYDASLETANQMCMIIDDKLVCAPMAEAMMNPASPEQG